jgi:hypothetical protein
VDGEDAEVDDARDASDEWIPTRKAAGEEATTSSTGDPGI